MRCASPSAIAVLPTPGSPMSTGLFFVRRDSTCMTRRISSSRPMTGSSLPFRAASVRSPRVALQGLVLVLRRLVGHAVSAAHSLKSLEQRIARGAKRRQHGAAFRALRLREREQQMLGRDVFVPERLRFLLGLVEDLIHLARKRRLRARLLREPPTSRSTCSRSCVTFTPSF